MKKKARARRSKKRRRWLLAVFLSMGLTVTSLGLAFFLSLPGVKYLETENPGTTALMKQRIREAAQKKEKLVVRRQWVPFDRIPLLLRQTVRISEDARFYSHEGIDYHELKEAIKRNLREGRTVRGGSTITQQLAKNLFLSTEKSYYRKLKEFFIAKKLERELSKQRIFCLYLNVIELGRGIFGVGAASGYYFGKSVEDLNLVETVRLAAVIPKPLRVNPTSDSRYLRWRANLLLDRLYKNRYITPTAYSRAKKEFSK